MADIVSPQKRSAMMRGIGSKDTKPELVVRHLLHNAGYRYRLHQKELPGKPDLVLRKHSAVVFVHGCFWHGHDNCHLFRLPKSRTEFWEEKIGKNTSRDQRQLIELAELGWRTAVIWECAIKGRQRIASRRLVDEISSFIENPKTKFLEVSGR